MQKPNSSRPIHIHFICNGNTYRSRLAETYLRSLKLPQFRVSSSGLEAKKNKSGPISWYAARLIKYHQLMSFVNHKWTYTTKRHLENADIIVIMHKSHLARVKNIYRIKEKKYHVWDVLDLDDVGFSQEFVSYDDDLAKIKTSEATFSQIKKLVDALIDEIQNDPHTS